MGVCEEVVMGRQIWFVRLVIMVLLVIGGVKLNPGPPVVQGKIKQILVHVQNQEKESKGIKSLLNTHSQEIKQIKDVTRPMPKI
jgi:hypothetical protein